jgi:L-threonylcarbamoyladenylate synthase
MRISLEQAAELLCSGHIVAVPTETVYGLAAPLDHPEAIEQIFRAKGRPQNNPLIIHVADIEEIRPFVSSFPPLTESLATMFWPGPLTLVLPILEEKIPSQARARLPTAAFRIPQHPIAQALLRRTGPLVMPSANKSGLPSATQAEHVENDFGDAFPVVDGGACGQGLESTILIYDADQWVAIRQGSIPLMNFKHVLGYVPELKERGSHETPLCPGQLYRHYAPHALLSLTATPLDEEVIVGFSDRTYVKPHLSLGPSTHPEIVAKNLYATLRQLDIQGYQTAWVDTHVPQTGLWMTILERLRKASQK